MVNSAWPARTTNISWPRSCVWPWATSPGWKRMTRERISGVMNRLRTSVRESKTSSATRVPLEVGTDDVADELDVGNDVAPGGERRLTRADALAEVLQLELERIVVPAEFLSPRRAIGLHAVQRYVRRQSARKAGRKRSDDSLARAVHLERLFKIPQLGQ